MNQIISFFEMKIKKNSALLILFVLTCIASNKALGQRSFEGILKYKVSIVDTSLREMFPDRVMTIYTNDTLVRIEVMNDQLGLQTTIRHMEMNKSYLLLDLGSRKFAIQTDLSTDSTKSKPYAIDYKCGRKKIQGLKTKKALVYREDLKENQEIYFAPQLKPEILNIYDGIKGLPIEYVLSSADGLMKYELMEINDMSGLRDYFGIPSDFKRVTFDEFVKEMKQEDN